MKICVFHPFIFAANDPSPVDALDKTLLSDLRKYQYLLAYFYSGTVINIVK